MPAPPKKPHLRERYDSRQRDVLDACARVFAERGYDGTTIDHLIAATGLTRGGLYHYIGSKSEALTRILDDLMGPLLERATAAVDGPDAAASASDQLRAVTRIWMRQVESHRAHVAVFEQERHTLQREAVWESARGDRRAFEQLLLRILRRGVADGELAIDDPQLAALALLGMVNHSALWFRPGGRLSADEVADGFVDVFLDGVRRS